jgi:Protein of unknown function (DUF1761)
MVPINFIVVLLAGLIPMVVGFIWYNKNVMGGVWMRESGYDAATAKTPNMGTVLGVGLLFSVMMSMNMMSVVIHPMGLYSMLADEPSMTDPNSDLSKTVADLMSKYGSHFRTFKHGVLHGVLTCLFFALPVIGMSALYEQKSAKYIAVHVGYWVISLGLMGGVICAFA